MKNLPLPLVLFLLRVCGRMRTQYLHEATRGEAPKPALKWMVRA